MFIELIAGGGLAIYGIVNGVIKVEDGRLPRCTYSALVGWWYGAFVHDTPAASIARLIESDAECIGWENGVDRWGDSTNELVNPTMKVRLKFNERYGNKGLASLYITDAPTKVDVHTSSKNTKQVTSGATPREIEIKVSAHDDYLLHSAYRGWVKRKKAKELRIANGHVDELLTQRINENYLMLIEKAQQNIAKTQLLLEDQTTFQATLPAPPMPMKERILVAGK